MNVILSKHGHRIAVRRMQALNLVYLFCEDTDDDTGEKKHTEVFLTPGQVKELIEALQQTQHE